MAQKWSSEQITVLIDAYKEEPCLYVTNSLNYHNKHLRTEALNRVNNAVLRLRPGVTGKECSSKFHNLRNQFNIEHSKAKSSLKSGTGTDDVYRPSLWYYEKLLFLESYVIPRKSKTSFCNEGLVSDVSLSQGAGTHTIEASLDEDNQYENVEYIDDDVSTDNEFGELKKVPRNPDEISSPVQVLGTDIISSPRCARSLSSPQRSRSSSLSPFTANMKEQNLFAHPSCLMQSGSSTSGVSSPNKRKKKIPVWKAVTNFPMLSRH